MKNLKKVLSLVLALAMAMSLMTTAFAAEDFGDADKINNTEAVTVMAALGVLEGSNGNFDPAGTLTREQGAKIIAYMVLGADAAEELTVASAPFADVKADRWSAPYIAWAVQEGILAGVGNNKFNPTGALTELAFAKMCLTALGYSAKIEGLTGDSWGINASKLAVSVGLNENIGALSATKAMAREDAAQMAFNTLTATLVSYTGGTDIKTADGTEITVGAIRDEVSETGYTNYDNTDDTPYAQFCEKYFSDLKKEAGDADDFGRPASHQWELDGDVIYTAYKDAVATFTAKTSAADVAKVLKGYKFSADLSNSNAAPAKIENTTNATITADVDITHTQAGANQATSTTWTLGDGSKTLAKQIADITANGKLVEIYANSDKFVTDLVMIEYATADVDKVTTDKKTGDVTYVIGGTPYVDYADEDETDKISFTKAPAKGDIVTYTKIGSKVYVYATTNFDGTQTATKTSDGVQTITVSGNAYTVGAAATGTFANSKDAATYYVDQFGFVVKTDSIATASTDYAIVVGTVATKDTTIDGTTPALSARVVLADGTVAVYNVALEEGEDTDAGKFWIKNIGDASNTIFTGIDTDTETTIATAASSDLTGIVAYTLDGKTITFESITALPGSGAATAENTVYTAAVGAASDYIANDNTSYTVNTDKTVLVNGDTKFVAYNTAKKTATVYTGVTALPDSVADNQTGYAVLKTGTTDKLGTASVVFFTIDAALSADTTSDYVYVDGTYTTVMIDGKDKYQYVGYNADGTTIDLIGANNSQAAGLYVPNKDNEISGTPKTNSDNALIINNGTLTVNGDMVKAGGEWYYMTADTQIVYVDSDLTEVDGNKGTVILVKDTKNIDVIYVTAEA